MRQKTIEMVGREDGRPEGYDIQPGSRTGCDQCYLDKAGRQYGYGEVVVVHPLYSPYPHPTEKDEKGKPIGDGITHHFCIGHLKTLLPNIVIVDPSDKFLCRDLDGNTWREQ